MRSPALKMLAAAVAATLAFGALDGSVDGAMARTKKHRAKRTSATVPGVIRDDRGTPIIMKGYHPALGIPDIMRDEKRTPPRVERRIAVPRGSSTYIPQPVPSPNSPNSPPSPVLLQPPPPPYQPPRLNTFQDRVINCIHSAPLNTGVGNNPPNAQAYIGQCAN